MHIILPLKGSFDVACTLTSPNGRFFYMKNAINLTKQLIQIPSYKDGKIFESKIGEFLSDYIQNNFPSLSVTIQYVSKNRYNLFVKDAYPTKLLVVDQIDTVMPSNDWITNPCTPVEKNGKIYGLGSSDSKGSVAAFLTALAKMRDTKGLAMLWYVDEEYDFAGMKTFVTSPLARKISPKYVLSIDGDGLKIGRGCRGVIEAKLILKGQTGHSARNIGVNVNRKFLELVVFLEEWLGGFQSEFLGKPTLNIARVNSGLFKEIQNKIIVFGQEGNRIPDYLEAILEIRTSSNALTFSVLKNFLEEKTKALNIKINVLENRFDLQGYETTKEELAPFLRLLDMKPNSFLDPSNFGFLDVALLKNRYPNATVFSLGAGSPDQAHSANEYITVSNVKKATIMYEKILNNLVEKGGE